MSQLTAPEKFARLVRKDIDKRLALCPSLPSLGSINKALQGLLQAEQRYSAHISEIVRRDPSLTSRLLRLVNSVYYGLATPVSSIEEAVFYLGVRQIRQLTTVTPIIEDFQRLTSQCVFPWRQFWQHCIGTAILTREVVSLAQTPADESDYVAGLVHDVGKIIMAWSFPDHFAEIHRQAELGLRDLAEIEREVLGVDHAELGALYLERHRLPELMVNAVRFHHHPEKAESHQLIIASVQIADLLMRNAQIGCSGNFVEVTHDHCLQASGWKILFPNLQDAGEAITRSSFNKTIERLPHMLEGLV
ncbi:MAG TPA: HDOD domain-containing protein [Verrucomicrobiae bacterium]|nr:HDOD domain-containing protein [Verrucomicrobiae bacterium]